MKNRYRLKSLTSLLLATVLANLTGCTKVYWRGDFESGDLSQWSYLLNPEGISLSSEHTVQGNTSARLVVRGEPDYLWNGDPHLNRVELQHKPATERTREGAELFIGWNFMLPKLLTASRHEFGYWESDGSYRQMMRFNLVGDTVSFQTTVPARLHWQAPQRLTPGVWHQIAMHIRWSADPEHGFVSVWFDGKQVLNRVKAQTLFNMEDPMFIQLGILRDQNPLEEEIYIDNAIEATSIAEILDRSPNR